MEHVWIGEERYTHSTDGNIETLKTERQELSVAVGGRLTMQAVMTRIATATKQEQTHRRKLAKGKSYDHKTATFRLSKPGKPQYDIEVRVYWRADYGMRAVRGPAQDADGLIEIPSGVELDGVLVRSADRVGAFPTLGQAMPLIRQIRAEAEAQRELLAA